MSKILKGFLEGLTLGVLDLHTLKVDPQDTMNVGSSSALEFNPVTYVPDTERAVGAKDDLLLEHLHAMLEIPRGQEYIPPDDLVLCLVDVLLDILLPGHLNGSTTLFYFHSNLKNVS